MTADTDLLSDGWVNCRICGEPDMWRRDGITTCTNIACASNAGTNANAFTAAEISRLTKEVEEARNKALEEAARQVPTNWLDPLLTGPNKIGDFDSKIEGLLLCVRERIRALSSSHSKLTETP